MTSLITMAQMLLICFPNVSNHDVISKHDIDGENDHVQCAHIPQKNKLKPLVKSSKIKQSHKSSHTIPKRLPNERCGERAKTKIIFFWFKATFVFGWKLTPTNG